MSFGKEITIELPYIKLAGLEYGDPDGEPVLALHGWLDNVMSFTRLVPKLEGMHVIALDLMGHGLSGHKPAGTGYQLWELVFSIAMAAQELGWKRYSILGHSLGAIIGVILASILPNNVQRLMLIDALTAIPQKEEDFPQQLQLAMMGFVKSLKQRADKKVYASLDEMIARRQQGYIPLSLEASTLLMERGVEKIEGGYRWRSDSQLLIPAPFPLTNEAAWSYAKQVACPIELILGKQGFFIHNKDFMQRLRSLTNCQVDILEGGHHLHLESEKSAQEIAECFNKFIRK